MPIDQARKEALVDLRELTPQTVTVHDLPRFPRMTGWFWPPLLSKLLLRVLISDVFGQYADRRLIQSSLDPASSKEILDRADLTKDLTPDTDGALWLDYVSDTGDGFDATYAIAYLLSQSSLRVGDGDPLPRGSLLVFGGDEVYPTATRDAYTINFRKPFSFAFPDDPHAPHPPALLVPGNHDWYDGLTNFLAFFCRKKATPIGSWRTRQRRSYFAVKLAENWWIWCIDIALVRDMDQPQADYFVAIAQAMPERANIILCSSEPGWYKADRDQQSYRTLSYAAWIAQNAKRDLRIPLILSGDTHHYARYSGAGAQFITSGGGGAFLHGTHNLKDEIKIDWLRHADHALRLKTAPEPPHEPVDKSACYPSREESRKLLQGNAEFACLNKGFSATLGTLYGVLAFACGTPPTWAAALISYLVLSLGFLLYTGYQADWAKRVYGVSAVHGAVHFAAMLVLGCVTGATADALHPLDHWHWLPLLLLYLVFGALLGGLMAGSIFGLYLWVTSRFLQLNDNDAFSSMRLDSHRHFLRIRLKGDTVEVYPIGVDRVPKRDEWLPNEARSPESPSVFRPKHMPIRLIEGPIRIDARAVPTTQDMKKAKDLPPTAKE